jgi:hypothetical protein
MLSKKIILPAALITVVGGGLILGVKQVSAQIGQNPFTGLVQYLSQKFGLNQSEVQSAVSDYQKQQMQNREQTRLDKLVSNGKITSAQEQAIIAELAALKTKYTPADFKNEQAELKSWAQSQGIDPTLVIPGFGMGGRRGGMKGNWPGHPSPTPTP